MLQHVTQSDPDIRFKSDTDKHNVVTHFVKKLLHETGGELHVTYAVDQTQELLETLAKNASGDDKTELKKTTASDIEDIITNSGYFQIGTGNFGKDVVEQVQTVGARPDWLSMPQHGVGSSSNSTSNGDVFSLEEAASLGEPTPIINLDCLTDHKLDALQDAGYKTYRDIHETDRDELTDVPGINNSLAEDIKSEAASKIDPLPDIAKDAYKREANLDDDKSSNAHKLVDVPIPSGDPRGPDYNDTNFHRFVYGLPILEKPTLDFDVLRDLAEDKGTLNNFLFSINEYIQYPVQYEGFKADIENQFDSLEQFKEAVTRPLDNTIEGILTQQGIKKRTLEVAIEAAKENNNLTQLSPRNAALAIDQKLADKAPEKTRIKLIDAIERELQNGNSDSLTDGQTLSDLVEATTSSIEVDHPLINDLDDFPEYRKRTLPSGETDIELVARLTADGEYVDLVGHAGIGKDTLVKILAAATNRPMTTINVDESMIAQNILGRHTIDEDGRIIFEDGPIPHAAKYGYWLYVAEPNAAREGVITALHQILERGDTICIRENDEVIHSDPSFKITTGRNPPYGQYNNVNELSPALKRRLNMVPLPYLDEDVESDLLYEMANEDREVLTKEEAEKLVEMATDFRNMADKSQDTPRISTTHLLQIASQSERADSLLESAKQRIKAELTSMQYRNRESIMNKIEDHLQ